MLIPVTKKQGEQDDTQQWQRKGRLHGRMRESSSPAQEKGSWERELAGLEMWATAYLLKPQNGNERRARKGLRAYRPAWAIASSIHDAMFNSELPRTNSHKMLARGCKKIDVHWNDLKCRTNNKKVILPPHPGAHFKKKVQQSPSLTLNSGDLTHNEKSKVSLINSVHSTLCMCITPTAIMEDQLYHSPWKDILHRSWTENVYVNVQQLININTNNMVAAAKEWIAKLLKCVFNLFVQFFCIC